MKHNFKKLIIWQDAMNFCDLIYNYTESLPLKEKYNLIHQLEKCGVSIPSNISEGSGKRTNIHFAEFLTTSLSSSFEAETQLLICERRKFGNKEQLDYLLKSVGELQQKIYNFRETIINSK
ncbi:diversity-generating retroelement protein bAvd family protein [Sphingobacteriaceae bacterium]|nr:diversity-generating retroelement protein bAvd family protein [Sphingobacteriaceae bacterium]